MPKFQVWLCIVVAIASGAFLRDVSFQSISPVHAADVTPQPVSHISPEVAVLDVTKVFKNCTAFFDQMERMKLKVAEMGKEVKVRQAESQKLADRLKELTVGSDEYNTLQREVVGKSTEHQLWRTTAQQSIMSEEAKIYAETYERIVEQTEKIARAKNVRLVVRFQSDAIDPAKRDSVLQGVNRPIVYQDGLDITDAVTAALNAE